MSVDLVSHKRLYLFENLRILLLENSDIRAISKKKGGGDVIFSNIK